MKNESPNTGDYEERLLIKDLLETLFIGNENDGERVYNVANALFAISKALNRIADIMEKQK